MKTLIALALAGATLAAAGGASAAPGAGNAEFKSPVRPHAGPNVLVNRCHLPRISVRREARKLRFAGFRRIRYQSTRTFRPRCAKFVIFSACKQHRRYKVIVRFIRGTRYVIVQRNGFCRHRPFQRTLRRS
jgi:hypothetical protein